MIEQLAESLTAIHIESGVISESQRALYKYGYTVLMEMFINFFLTFMMGIWSGKVSLVVIFSLMFIPLRSYCGGWHAHKDWMCMLFSLGTLFVVIFFERYLFLFRSQLMYIEVISVIAILRLAPMDSDTKPLDEKERKNFRNIARVILFLEILILLVSIYFKCRLLVLSIIFAHGFQGMSLILYIPQKQQMDSNVL